MPEPLIRIEKLRREYPVGDGHITVLDDVDLEIPAGQVVGIVGPSGSGKSTLAKLAQRLYVPEPFSEAAKADIARALSAAVAAEPR